MLTIQTTGDDAWDTDVTLINALHAAHVKVDNGVRDLGTFEIAGCNDKGEILLIPVKDGSAVGMQAIPVLAHNITIEVL
jgi:hypothetical protein